ncbi:hypothetical protein KUTeg_001988 [Tegillarca granosa]|uniref:Spermatogenesis-associated serine-rich protein 2 n=1 Tax=Tegillarca granosa TaxID=220873 RepID=A0ABQ9FUG5_TEGGR|nr:hypothetical protein KUTeg_001988 [Tegillarca granosa]
METDCFLINLKQGQQHKTIAKGSLDTGLDVVVFLDTGLDVVASVREIVTGRSTNEIILVLQFYDYDVEKAIQAFLEDGAKEALTQWHFSGKQTPNKKKKNRKKKQSTEVVPTAIQNGEINGTKSLPNGSIDHEGSDISKLTESDSEIPTIAKLESPSLESNANVSDLGVLGHTSNNNQHSPSTEKSSDKSSNMQQQLNNHSDPSPQPQRQPHHPHHNNHRHRADSGSHSHSGRHRTTSEKSTSSVSEHKPSHYKLHAGLERAVKDLHRQTVSLERLRLVLNEEVDKAYKRIKTVFEEMRTCLNNREVTLIQEMDQHFVTDRKIDEDLGRTTRFLYDSDHLSAEIKEFGEVVPVKCIYSQRRPSVSSVAISHSEPHESLNASQAHEVAELQKRLKGSLQLQGYAVKSATYTNSRPSTAPVNRPTSGNSPSVNRDENDNRRNRRFGPRGGGGGRGGYRQQSTEQNARQDNSNRNQRSQYGRGGRGSGRGRGNYQGNQAYSRPRSPRKDGPRESTQGSLQGSGDAKTASVTVNSVTN